MLAKVPVTLYTQWYPKQHYPVAKMPRNFHWPLEAHWMSTNNATITTQSQKAHHSHYASGPKHIQTLQMLEVHPVPHSRHVGILHFYYSKQRPDNRATLLLSSHSSFIKNSWAPWWSVVFASTCTKCLVQNVGHPGVLHLISMIQVPFCSSCVALQYEPWTKCFHWAVPELHTVKNWCKNFISVHKS